MLKSRKSDDWWNKHHKNFTRRTRRNSNSIQLYVYRYEIGFELFDVCHKKRVKSIDVSINRGELKHIDGVSTAYVRTAFYIYFTFS